MVPWHNERSKRLRSMAGRSARPPYRGGWQDSIHTGDTFFVYRECNGKRSPIGAKTAFLLGNSIKTAGVNENEGFSQRDGRRGVEVLTVNSLFARSSWFFSQSLVTSTATIHGESKVTLTDAGANGASGSETCRPRSVSLPSSVSTKLHFTASRAGRGSVNLNVPPAPA